MIKELVKFTANLDEDFKNLGAKPKEGLHILLNLIVNDSIELNIDNEHFEYELFSKKLKSDVSDFLNQCKSLHQNAWCIDTNKCFDLPVKAIHTCSPFAVAFKREHLRGGAKYLDNEGKKKKQIYERFGDYFNKAFALFDNKEDSEKYIIFRNVFTHDTFSSILRKIEEADAGKRAELENRLEQKKETLKATSDKAEKEQIKGNISELEEERLKVRPLEDSDYIIFYLNVPLDLYKEVHKKYLDNKLFNTASYNTELDGDGLIYGTSNFMNGYNSNMPFLLHQTASFDISGRISNIEAKLLNDLKNLLPNKTLPNPLPIFIYKEELQQKVIGIFKDSGFKFGYKEIIQKLVENNATDVSNYYLLFWQNTKDGIVFRDFDFVSKFEYAIHLNLAILNLFEIKAKDSKEDKHYPHIKNIFDFEQKVFKPLIENKYFKIDYFKDLDPEDYKDRTKTPNIHYTNRFISYSKYRKAVYDFAYKSKRNTISGNAFYELVFNSILDDIKNGNEYGIKKKLNIWYSLYEYFNPKQKINMVNKLKEYQDFVATIIADDPLADITDEKFAFAAGQVIEYILSKSKSADNSYNLLEPYLQQSKCAEFKKAIAIDFGRYKHENFSKNFEKVAAFVLSYETDTNLKHLLPQILSGVFSKNQLFSTNNSKIN